MSVVRYEPWGLLNQLHSEIDRLFDTRMDRYGEDNGQLATCDWVPAVDIKEEAERYVLYVDVPGVEPKDIEVHMENGVLSIKGNRELESKQEPYKRVERVRGSFFRRFTMPDTVNAESISATSKNGVLEIVVPKQAQKQPQRIKVVS